MKRRKEMRREKEKVRKTKENNGDEMMRDRRRGETGGVQ